MRLLSEQTLIQEATKHYEAEVGKQQTINVFAGPDGFIDQIIDVVDKRQDAESYTAIKTISQYASRLAEAAGKSTNIEFVVKQIKSGGNGPLMSEALGRLGAHLHYVGCLGLPEINPVFKELEKYGKVESIAEVAQTLATEFEDGKIMNGLHQPLKDVTWENFEKHLGGEDRILEILKTTNLVALLNWTMLPHLNGIYRGVLNLLMQMDRQKPDFFFFDLCDPEKRTEADLNEALRLISEFSEHGTTVLGLNEKESQEVAKTLGAEVGSSDLGGLLKRAQSIQHATGIKEIVIHPRHAAVVFSSEHGSGQLNGPVCAKPKLTTGAGDHFNGGYMFGRLCGLSPEEALVTGKAVSGFYVRQGRGPSKEELPRFTSRWIDGTLDPWKEI